MTNKINYIDFEPEVISKSMWKGSKYELTTVVLERANEWIRKNYNLKIMNVETLVVPRMSHSKKKGENVRMNLGGGIVYMIEVIRVWYQ